MFGTIHSLTSRTASTTNSFSIHWPCALATRSHRVTTSRDEAGDRVADECVYDTSLKSPSSSSFVSISFHSILTANFAFGGCCGFPIKPHFKTTLKSPSSATDSNRGITAPEAEPKDAILFTKSTSFRTTLIELELITASDFKMVGIAVICCAISKISTFRTSISFKSMHLMILFRQKSSFYDVRKTERKYIGF